MDGEVNAAIEIDPKLSEWNEESLDVWLECFQGYCGGDFIANSKDKRKEKWILQQEGGECKTKNYEQPLLGGLVRQSYSVPRMCPPPRNLHLR